MRYCPQDGNTVPKPSRPGKTRKQWAKSKGQYARQQARNPSATKGKR